MKLPDKIYDGLKWVMLLATPVLTFILGLVQAIPTGDISAILTAVIGGLGTLAGAVIKISNDNYYKGASDGNAE